MAINTDTLRERLILTDYLFLLFDVYLILIILLFPDQALKNYSHFLYINIALLSLFIVSIYKEESENIFHWLHLWFPIISCMFFYIEASSLDNLIFSHTFDNFLNKIDIIIFRKPIYLILSKSVNSLLVDEIMHAMYFSYYVLLFLPGLFIFRVDKEYFKKMVFGITLMFYTHYLFFMFFPADGPIHYHDKLFPSGVVFIPLMKIIYLLGEQGGGAFPSTHVSASLLVFLFSREYFKERSCIVGFFAVGVFLATFYCSYHYVIDSVAGIITGFIFYRLSIIIWEKYKNYF
ncbi:MAG: phosphatase PAP2 family protein [Candidatus Marinimicrobia bacterium]|nr:phosphatase PAP2 family protein [Candidatus Neomarinimicrobiota bacterium]